MLHPRTEGGLARVAVVSPAERGVDADGYADGCDASEVLAWVAIVSPAERGVDEDACSAVLSAAGLDLLFCRILSASWRHWPMSLCALSVKRFRYERKNSLNVDM